MHKKTVKKRFGISTLFYTLGTFLMLVTLIIAAMNQRNGHDACLEESFVANGFETSGEALSFDGDASQLLLDELPFQFVPSNINRRRAENIWSSVQSASLATLDELERNAQDRPTGVALPPEIAEFLRSCERKEENGSRYGITYECAGIRLAAVVQEHNGRVLFEFGLILLEESGQASGGATLIRVFPKLPADSQPDLEVPLMTRSRVQHEPGVPPNWGSVTSAVNRSSLPASRLRA